MTKNSFELNGKTIIARDFDFNMVCEFEDKGISLTNFGDRNLSLIRAYVASCMNIDVAEAGLMLQEHIKAGGSFDDVSNVIAKKVSESDFFQALNKTTEKENPKVQAKANK